MDLLSIFKAITPENIQEIPLIKVAMEIFCQTLEENTQVAQRISAIYDDFDPNGSTLSEDAKYNLRTGMYLIYTNTLYSACSKMSEDPEILKTLTKFNYTEAKIREDLNHLINSEFMSAQRQFSQTVGTEKALHYMYSFAKYLETGYVRDDLEISKRDPFIIHYEGSLNKRTFETVVYPQAHPLGWAYSYTTVITQALRDYYGITLIYDVKKLWLVNYAEGLYIVFTDKTTEEIYAEFRVVVNPKTGAFFTDEEIARQVTIYTGRKVVDYQRWEDENGNWCQLFTFDDDMVLYHDGSKHISYYTSYEDYIDGCKEPQNVWDQNFAVVPDIKQDVKFEYFDSNKFEKKFEITRVRDDDHKIGDSHYMSDEKSNAFGVVGAPYVFNQGVDEATHILREIEKHDDVPVGGYWLPKSETLEKRVEDLEEIAYRLNNFAVYFDDNRYDVVGYNPDIDIFPIDEPLFKRIELLEKEILPLHFITSERAPFITDDTDIELIVDDGSSITTVSPLTDYEGRVALMESVINTIAEVYVTYKGRDYDLLKRLKEESTENLNIYTLGFKQDYEGNIKLYASDLLEIDENIKDRGEFAFDTTSYHGNVLRVEITDLLDIKHIVETNTMNRDALVQIKNCVLSTYGKSIHQYYDENGNIQTVEIQTDKGSTIKYGLTIYGRCSINAGSDQVFVFDNETFDSYPFMEQDETVYLELEDDYGKKLLGHARTKLNGDFVYTFDTSSLAGTSRNGSENDDIISHKFKVYAYILQNNRVKDSCYYKGDWLNDFDKTPFFIELPYFKRINKRKIIQDYYLEDITPNKMVGLNNSNVDVSDYEDYQLEVLPQNRVYTEEEVLGDISSDNFEIVKKTMYRNYAYIGEKISGFYEPDKWSSDYLNPSYKDDPENQPLYMPFTGFIQGNIIEGENYYNSTWRAYPEEEVFINEGFKRYAIDTSDFYIMDSTRFVTDDFEINSIGDDYYLFGTDNSYFYTTDEQYLVTDEDDKLVDAYGIHKDDGMDHSEWEILYRYNGAVLKDFTTFEDDLIAPKHYIDAFKGDMDTHDSMEIKFKGKVGQKVRFTCIGDGIFSDDTYNPVTKFTSCRHEVLSNGSVVETPLESYSVDRFYKSTTNAVVQSNGYATVEIKSLEPFEQNPLVRAEVDVEVDVPDVISHKGEYTAEGAVPDEVTYHKEMRTFKHDIYLLYKITEYIPKIDLPRYITPEGYSLTYKNLLPHSQVYQIEPQLIPGKVKDDGTVTIDFPPKKFGKWEDVIHTIRYYEFGTRTNNYSFFIPYVDMHFDGDREIINSFDSEEPHITKMGYAYAYLTGCRSEELLTFTPLGDCTLAEVPERADKNGDARVKIYSASPWTENPGVRVHTHMFDIIKEVHFTFNPSEFNPTLELPTLTNLYGTFKNTIDTDTPYVVKLSGLLPGSTSTLYIDDAEMESLVSPDGTLTFNCKGVSYKTTEMMIKVKYRKTGKDYDYISKKLFVYQYKLSYETNVSTNGKSGIDAYYTNILSFDTKVITVKGGKPTYPLSVTINGDGSFTQSATFNSDGRCDIKIKSREPFKVDPVITAISQGYSVTVTTPYELTEYVPTVEYGHIVNL